MLIILGESLATGKYSFSGGLGGDMADEEDLQEAIVDEDDESQYHPLLRSQLNSQLSTRPNTPRPGTSTSQTPSQTPFDSQADDTQDDNGGDNDGGETISKKRHRESASLQPIKGVLAKKPKVSSLNVIDKMSANIAAIASAYSSDVSSSQHNIVESVGDTLQGQAQEKIQEEGCLTDEGLLVMLELLTDTNMARTFLAIKKDDLKAKWIKKQLEKHVEKEGRDINKLYLDFVET